MAENPNVVVRFTDEEKAALVELAQHFHRSQTGILRALVTSAVAVLREQDALINQPKKKPVLAKKLNSKN